MKRDPLLEYDDRFVYADDVTRLSLREIVKVTLGTLWVFGWLCAFVVLVSVS